MGTVGAAICRMTEADIEAIAAELEAAGLITIHAAADGTQSYTLTSKGAPGGMPQPDRTHSRTHYGLIFCAT